jgi:hypothetical protein
MEDGEKVIDKMFGAVNVDAHREAIWARCFERLQGSYGSGNVLL